MSSRLYRRLEAKKGLRDELNKGVKAVKICLCSESRWSCSEMPESKGVGVGVPEKKSKTHSVCGREVQSDGQVHTVTLQVGGRNEM